MSTKLQLTIWEKLTRLVYLLFFVAGVVGLALWYRPLIKQEEEMRRDIRALEREIQVENRSIRELQEAIRLIKNDKATVERLSREQLGYAKPGDTVFRFRSDSSYKQTAQKAVQRD